MNLKTFAVILFLSNFYFVNNLYSQDYQVITKEIQAAFTPQSALDSLKTGNKRFVDDTQVHRKFIDEANLTADKQYPYAVIVSCIDSRVSSEIVFDQGLGSIFNARIAGNIINEDILGSLEFACKVSGAKLIIVLGHDNCGAVKGACDDVQLGNLTALLDKIKPAVDSVRETGERNSKNHKFVEEVARENVILAIHQVKERSPILMEMLDKGQIGIKGAMYDLESGVVTFYED